MMTFLDGGDRNQVRLIVYDTLANRPVAGIAGRQYWTTDERILYRDTGATWEPIGMVGLEIQTQTQAWKDPTGATYEGRVVLLENTTQVGYRLCAYMNGAWRNIELLG